MVENLQNFQALLLIKHFSYFICLNHVLIYYAVSFYHYRGLKKERKTTLAQTIIIIIPILRSIHKIMMLIHECVRSLVFSCYLGTGA